MSNLFHNKRGYLLIETVTAMALLSITIVSIHGAMRQSALTRAQAEDFTYARFMAEELMGQLELRPTLPLGSHSGEYGGRFSRFEWAYDVTHEEIEVPEIRPGEGAGIDEFDEEYELPVPYLGKVRVEIQWTRLGQHFSYVVETLLSPEQVPQPEELQ